LLVLAVQLVQLVDKVTLLILVHYMPMAVPLVVLVLDLAHQAAVEELLDMLEQAVLVLMQ
jgi:hypothetical protein